MGISKKLLCLIHFYYYVFRYENCQSFGTELLKIFLKKFNKGNIFFYFLSISIAFENKPGSINVLTK